MMYNDLYQTWLARTSPSATKSRMTRTTLKYLATALDHDDWSKVEVMSLQQALVLLDAAMATKDLRSQSRSNYRNYLRQLYRFAANEGIDVTGGDTTHLWPALPANNGVVRRAQVAYDRFVKWAIGRTIWPGTVRPGDLVDWALNEKAGSNLHWRKDYQRLTDAWQTLVEHDGVRSLVFASLPAKLNERYAVSIDEWPAHLQTEWQRMCRDASAPLRKGGMRPWRPITKAHNEQSLSKFLGWIRIDQPERDLTTDTWASLPTADYCQAFVNWLVVRSGSGYLNPAHTAFLRTVRGFHRFLLGSGPENTVILSADVFHASTVMCCASATIFRTRATIFPAGRPSPRLRPEFLLQKVKRGCRHVLDRAEPSHRQAGIQETSKSTLPQSELLRIERTSHAGSPGHQVVSINTHARMADLSRMVVVGAYRQPALPSVFSTAKPDHTPSATHAMTDTDWLSWGPGRTALTPSHRTDVKVGRNDPCPCPCGSGRKYKKCRLTRA